LRKFKNYFGRVKQWSMLDIKDENTSIIALKICHILNSVMYEIITVGSNAPMAV
jgi:hypothetical protein